MSLHFLKPGLQTSVQDGGRPGMMQWGLSRGGAADSFAMALANLLLGNPRDHACLEIAITGPVIEFTTALSVAICGARFDLVLNDTPVDNDTALQVQAGDQLKFGALRSGARAYLALAAEVDLPRLQGSLSTNLLAGFGGFQGRALTAGDSIPLRNCRQVSTRTLPQRFRVDYSARPLIRVVPGMEANRFSAEALQHFYQGQFAVSSQSNRMGIRLSGEPLPLQNSTQLVSSGLCPGTIQVPPNGLPIISFVEGQTIGGYPRLGHVISADLHRLGQLQARARIDFELVDLQAAHHVLRSKNQLLAGIAEALK